MELVFDGLLNPPGPMTAVYAPHLYGPNPLFGFVEFDVDTNGDSGGNVDAPLIRYNGNVARFGGLPVGGAFKDRISTNGWDPDGLYETPPWIDRSGGDFELEFRGDEVTAIQHIAGDSDGIFEKGETWDLYGRFFRREQGYDACAGGPYEPVVCLRFAHVPPTITTTGLRSTAPVTEATDPPPVGGVKYVTFIYPLTNEAYAEANGQSVEPGDTWDFNANSILEGLEILKNSAQAALCPGSYEFSGLIHISCNIYQ